MQDGRRLWRNEKLDVLQMAAQSPLKKRRSVFVDCVQRAGRCCGQLVFFFSLCFFFFISGFSLMRWRCGLHSSIDRLFFTFLFFFTFFCFLFSLFFLLVAIFIADIIDVFYFYFFRPVSPPHFSPVGRHVVAVVAVVAVVVVVLLLLLLRGHEENVSSLRRGYLSFVVFFCFFFPFSLPLLSAAVVVVVVVVVAVAVAVAVGP